MEEPREKNRHHRWFWPQHRRLAESQGQVRSLQERLTSAESRVRLGEILGQLLQLSDAVRAKNFGQAATLSSAFFDPVKGGCSRQPAGGDRRPE